MDAGLSAYQCVDSPSTANPGTTTSLLEVREYCEYLR
jgi:hypothetical protein